MKYLISFLPLLFISFATQAQGCSDAGACTMPGFTPINNNQGPFQLDLRFSLEASEPGALILSPQLWFHYKNEKNFRADIKLPFWFVSDDLLGSVNTISDPIISLSWQVLNHKEKLFLDVFTGMRIGLNNANLENSFGDNMPMDYQSSLGTTDLILGTKAHYENVSASIGIQYPVWQYNQNQHVVEKYNKYEDFAPFLRFYRKPDLVIRLDYNLQLDKWIFQAGILPIFHLANDELQSTQNSGIVTIEGSKGLTLNIPFSAGYQAGNWFFGFNVGFPVLVRDERPDGLTRKYVFQPRIALNL